MSKQSITDRIIAAKHTVVGQGLAKSCCKATTEEIIGPKKKHLDYLLQCTNEPNVSIPQLADILIQRTQMQNWVVVYKSLITIHNLMNYGNERFTQYLASNNCTFNLSNFIDKTGVQGYDMSKFIRRYAAYMNEKAVSYRQMAFDFCKVKRGKEDGMLRTMNGEKLLKALPILQQQIDALLEFDCTPNELTNGVINACFMLLFKDLIRLFACYNDGIINLLEKYFEMNKKQCKEALDIYKKFLVRMDKVAEFLKVAENVGIDKGDIPDLAKGLKHKACDGAPASLLDALEQHLAALEGKKGAPVTSISPRPAGVTSAINSLSTNSVPGGTAVNANQLSEAEKRRILEEENRKLQELKEQKLREQHHHHAHVASPSRSQPAAPNPFTAPVSVAQQPQPTKKSIDLFGAAEPVTDNQSNKPSDDLLQLSGNNPFAANVQTVINVNNAVHAMQSPQNSAFSSPQHNAGGWGQSGFPSNGSGGFASEAGFAAAFGSGSTTGGGLGGSESGFDGFGEVLTPSSNQPQTQQTDGKLILGDVDNSLAQLTGNLDLKHSNQIKKTQHEWKPKGDQKKTGGSNFQSQPMAQATTWVPGMSGQAPPMTAPMMAPGYQPAMQQPYMGMQQPRPMGMGMGMQQPMGMGMQTGMPMNSYQQPRPQQPNDPFGAL